MDFVVFSQLLKKLETTASRLEMTAQLGDLYQQLSPSEIQPATYLMQGRLVPTFESLEFSLSTKMVQKALAKLMEKHQANSQAGALTQTNLFGEEDNQHFLELVKKEFRKLGDLGLAAEKIMTDVGLGENTQNSPQSSTPIKVSKSEKLSIEEIFTALQKIAQEEGVGSQERKIVGLVNLLEKVKPLSARYIIRIIIGKLRLGFSTMTLLDALSWAAKGDKSDRSELEIAFNKQADVGSLGTAYLAAPNQTARKQVLADYSVQNTTPVVPALAQRLNSTKEVVEKMGQVIAEPKYDGLRIQIHFQGARQRARDDKKKTRAFTRNLEDVSHMFPELQQASSALDCTSCILDGEAIGYDPQTDQLLAFQKTITRRRKHQVADQAKAVPIRFYIFDILEVNGESLVDQPLSVRKKKLSQVLGGKSDHSQPLEKTYKETEFFQSNDPSELKKFHQEQLAAGLEGAIFKKTESLYRGGRKGWRWVKMKEAEGERGKLNDTLDVIVMGYYSGKGKRTEFGLGAILVGIRDEKSGRVKTLSKIGTGLTDEQLKEMKMRLDNAAALNNTQPKNYQVPKELIPDYWAEPMVVIEVAADEITTSPLHSAGVALRFPRLITFRDDKTWEEATSIEETKQITISQ